MICLFCPFFSFWGNHLQSRVFPFRYFFVNCWNTSTQGLGLGSRAIPSWCCCRLYRSVSFDKIHSVCSNQGYLKLLSQNDSEFSMIEVPGRASTLRFQINDSKKHFFLINLNGINFLANWKILHFATIQFLWKWIPLKYPYSSNAPREVFRCMQHFSDILWFLKRRGKMCIIFHTYHVNIYLYVILNRKC